MNTDQFLRDFVSKIAGHFSEARVSDWLAYFLKLLLLQYLFDLAESDTVLLPRVFTKMPDGIRRSVLEVTSRDAGLALDKAVRAIGEANPKLKPAFGTVSFGNLPDKLLFDLFSDFSSSFGLAPVNSSMPFTYSEIAERALEFAASVHKKSERQHFTPPWVAQLLAELLAPEEGMSICDPACGTGGLLVECAKHLQLRKKDASKLQLYGQELNTRFFEIAQINLLLHGLDNFDISCGDTLREPRFVRDDKLVLFDLAISVPPFSLSNWGYEEAQIDKLKRFQYGVPPKHSGDFAFIQHTLAMLKDSGRAVMIVAPGVLFRGGVEGEIRSKILRADLVEATIGLSNNLLYVTGLHLAVLVFNRSKPTQHKGQVLVIDASKDYEKRDRGQYTLSERNISAITDAFKKFEDLEGYTRVISKQDLERNDYQLNVNRYISLPRKRIDIKGELKRLHELELERARAEKEMNDCLLEFGIDPREVDLGTGSGGSDK